MKPWETLSTEIVNKNPWTEFRHDRFVLPTGKEGNYYYLHTTGSVIVIPVRDDGRIVMVKRHLYLFDREAVEFPGGGKKESQTYEEAARAELKEEAGYTAGNLEHIHDFAPAKGVFDETCGLYVASDLKAGEAEPDETEFFEPLAYTFDEMEDLIKRKEIWCGFALASWMMARERVKEIIDAQR